jgi:hypothetical protein
MILRAAFALYQIIGIGIGFSTTGAIIAVTASFGITTLFGIDSFGLLCAIIPIKSYFNAEADKAKILKENQNKLGIYLWKNLVNKKKYIGSSDNLNRRFL